MVKEFMALGVLSSRRARVPPLFVRRESESHSLRPAARVLHLVGLGLLIHMALDWIDCVNDSSRQWAQEEQEVIEGKEIEILIKTKKDQARLSNFSWVAMAARCCAETSCSLFRALTCS